MVVVGLAFAYLVAARLAYVLWVGATLRRQDREQHYTNAFGAVPAYERFKKISNLLMINDSVAFILLNLVTIDTMSLPVPRVAQVVFGLAIGIFGIAVKVWATRTLGPKSYFWHNFFVPAIPTFPDPPGPYRYLRNPMYGVGYLQTYGLAFLCASLWGMIASAFMHVSIWIFNEFVEKPHFLSLLTSAPDHAASVRAAEREGGTTAPRFS